MCLTMIDPASGWFKIVELPIHEIPKKKSKKKGQPEKTEYFDKTSAQISRLVNKLWFSRYPSPRCQQIIFDIGSEFRLHFEGLSETCGIKRKPNTIKNPQSNAILERVHQIVTSMLHTSEFDMADTLTSDFLDNAAWAICSTYHVKAGCSFRGNPIICLDHPAPFSYGSVLVPVPVPVLVLLSHLQNSKIDHFIIISLNVKAEPAGSFHGNHMICG